MSIIASGNIVGSYIEGYSSGSAAYSHINERYRLRVAWEQTANTRNLRLKVAVLFMSNDSELIYGSPAPGTLTVDGTAYSFSMANGTYGPGIATYELLTKDVTIGAKATVPLAATIKFNNLRLYQGIAYLNTIGFPESYNESISWINYSTPAVPNTAVLSFSGWKPTITWSQAAGTAEANRGYFYDIERSSNGGASWETHASNVEGTSYSSGVDLTPGSWKFRVRAKNVAGASAYKESNSAGALAPLKPDLSAAKGTGSSVNLAWTNQGTALYPVNSYTLERKVNSGSFAVLTSKTSTSTSHADSGLTKGTNYTYRMKAHGVGDSPYSDERTVRIPYDVPAAAALSGSASDNDIALTWTLSPGPDNPVHSIVVEKKGANNSFTDVSGTLASDVRSFAHNDQSRGTTHTYRVKTVNTDEVSYSYETGVYVKFLPPAKPASVFVERVSHEKFKLTWAQSVSADAPVTGFNIYRKVNGGSWALLSDTVASGARSYEDNTVALGTTYAYYIVAKNSDGSTDSDASNSLTNPAGIPVYNGTSYVIRPVYVFDGTNWVHRPMYVYNGSTWHWRG